MVVSMKVRKAVRTAVDQRPALPEPHLRRTLRRKSGLSQEELAGAIGVSGAALGRWENGTRTPRGENRERYAEALDELAGL